MALAPSGPLSLPLKNLQTLVSNSSTFQTWVGAADAATAAARIYLVGEDKSATTRPFAVVHHLDPAEFNREAQAGGAVQCFVESGAVGLIFEDDVGAAYAADHADAEMEFTNIVGAVISEMEDLAGSGAYLNVTRFGVITGPARSALDEAESEGDYYGIQFRVEYGP